MDEEEMTDLVGEHLFENVLERLNDGLSLLGIEHAKASAGNIETLARSQQSRQSLLHEICQVLHAVDVFRSPVFQLLR